MEVVIGKVQSTSHRSHAQEHIHSLRTKVLSGQFSGLRHPGSPKLPGLCGPAAECNLDAGHPGANIVQIQPGLNAMR